MAGLCDRPALPLPTGVGAAAITQCAGGTGAALAGGDSDDAATAQCWSIPLDDHSANKL